MSAASTSSVLVWDTSYIVLEDVRKIIFPENVVHFLVVRMLMYNPKIAW